MSFSRKFLAIVAFIAVSFTATIWLIDAKGSILGPQVAKCPAAINNMYSLFSTMKLDPDTIQNIWDCSIGGLLYLAIPGLGLGWLIAKKIAD